MNYDSNCVHFFRHQQTPTKNQSSESENSADSTKDNARKSEFQVTCEHA